MSRKTCFTLFSKPRHVIQRSDKLGLCEVVQNEVLDQVGSVARVDRRRGGRETA